MIEKLTHEYDQKIAGFLTAADTSCDSKVQNYQNTVNNTIEKVKVTITKQESRTNSKIDQIMKSSTEQIKNVETPCPSWSDLESHSNRCRSANETTHADMTNLKEQMDTINARVASLSETQQPSQGLIQINRMEEEIKTLKSNMANMNQNLDLSGARIHQAQINQESAPNSYFSPERGHRKPYEIPIPQKNIKVLICMDSNGKRLNRRKFWTLNGSVWRTTYRVEHIKNVLSLCVI